MECVDKELSRGGKGYFRCFEEVKRLAAGGIKLYDKFSLHVVHLLKSRAQ